MKEFKNDTTAALSRFGRDKRTRMSTQTAQRVERGPHRESDGDYAAHRTDYRGDRDNEGAEGLRPHKRASYNPNFTDDNRPYGAQRYGSSRDGSGRYGRGNYGGGNREGREGYDSRDNERGGYGNYGHGGHSHYGSNGNYGSNGERRY